MGDPAISTDPGQPIITSRDYGIVRQFIAKPQLCKNVSTGRANKKIIYAVMTWWRFNGPFDSNGNYRYLHRNHCAQGEKSRKDRPFKLLKSLRW